MNTEKSLADAGLEIVQHPITHVRIHRTDGRWLVEYRRKPKWFIDGFWWFNDGKYVQYTDALARVEILKERGYYTFTRYINRIFKVGVVVHEE